MEMEDKKRLVILALIVYFGMMGLFYAGSALHVMLNPWIYLEGVQFYPWQMIISHNAIAWYFVHGFAVWLWFASFVSMIVTTLLLIWASL